MPSQVFDVFIENQHDADAAEGFGLVDILFRPLSQSLTSQAEPSYIRWHVSNIELRSSGEILLKETSPTLAPSAEVPKGGRDYGKSYLTFLQHAPQPDTFGIHHQDAKDYKNGSRHDRKNQPHNAQENKNPPSSNDGEALEFR
jgi:hypothetical protein